MRFQVWWFCLITLNDGFRIWCTKAKGKVTNVGFSFWKAFFLLIFCLSLYSFSSKQVALWKVVHLEDSRFCHINLLWVVMYWSLHGTFLISCKVLSVYVIYYKCHKVLLVLSFTSGKNPLLLSNNLFCLWHVMNLT